MMNNQIIISRQIPLKKYLIAVNTALYIIPKKYIEKLKKMNVIIINIKKLLFASDILNYIDENNSIE